MKKKNKGKKSLTAVGAVVAAGLTPGIATGAPASLPPGPDVELTAANTVSINGEAFDFDELFAMQQIKRGNHDIPKMYGPPVSVREQEEKARQEAQREQARQDSIRQVMESQATVYGPPRPKYHFIGPEELRSLAADNKEEATNVILNILMDYCSQMPDVNGQSGIILSENSDLVGDLKMDSSQLKDLQQEIENRFAVQMTEDMLKRLSSLQRIANFIVEVIKPIGE